MSCYKGETTHPEERRICSGASQQRPAGGTPFPETKPRWDENISAATEVSPREASRFPAVLQGQAGRLALAGGLPQPGLAQPSPLARFPSTARARSRPDPSRASRGAHSSASAAACPARTDTARPAQPRSRALRCHAAVPPSQGCRSRPPRRAAACPAGQPWLLPSCALPSVSALAWKMKFVRACGRWRSGLFGATENRSPRDQGFSSSHGHPRGWLHITLETTQEENLCVFSQCVF